MAGAMSSSGLKARSAPASESAAEPLRVTNVRNFDRSFAASMVATTAGQE
jgi:hypothetical protein